MVKLMLGDCLKRMKQMRNNSVDSIVTDPPYGLSFMGNSWDYDVPKEEIWAECLRVLKPGGHLLAFFGTRTYHRGVCRIEDAGFEIRDQIQWIYGSGFPKSLNLKDHWQGWGTALKPANEPIVVARKPLDKGLTVAENVLIYGTGALNIDGSRIGEFSNNIPSGLQRYREWSDAHTGQDRPKKQSTVNQAQGRWPANVIFDEESAEELDNQTGTPTSGKPGKKKRKGNDGAAYGAESRPPGTQMSGFGDSGGASRFFYVAKASKSERNTGLDSYEQVVISNECKEENTEAVQLLQRAISESTVKWSTGECGKKLMAIFPKDSRSTIETEINKIIESKTWNASMLSLINESTQDVSEISSHAESAEILKTYLLSFTNEKTGLALGAASVASRMLLSIKEKEGKDFANGHATVKPTKLMGYLCNLVTPPAGTVMDPFMGSGSTGVAALRGGFSFIGIEREPQYFGIAEKRINPIKVNKCRRTKEAK